MIILKRGDREYHNGNTANLAGTNMYQRLSPDNVSIVSYNKWHKRYIDLDNVFLLILELANKNTVSNLPHRKIIRIIKSLDKKHIIAVLTHPTGGNDLLCNMCFFSPEVDILKKMNAVFITDVDNIHWSKKEGPLVQHFLDRWVIIGYPAKYVHQYWLEEKRDYIFVPYAYKWATRNGQKAFNKARDIASKYNYKIIFPIGNYISNQYYDNVYYVPSLTPWTPLLSRCKICIDLTNCPLQGKVAAECAAVGTFYYGTGNTYFGRKVWQPNEHSIEEVILHGYNRDKYYHRLLNYDIQNTIDKINDYFSEEVL